MEIFHKIAILRGFIGLILYALFRNVFVFYVLVIVDTFLSLHTYVFL